jgi:hypothetical protein
MKSETKNSILTTDAAWFLAVAFKSPLAHSRTKNDAEARSDCFLTELPRLARFLSVLEWNCLAEQLHTEYGGILTICSVINI